MIEDRIHQSSITFVWSKHNPYSRFCIDSLEKETTIRSPAHPSVLSAEVRSLPSSPRLEVDIPAV